MEKDVSGELDFDLFMYEVARLSLSLPLVAQFARHRQPPSSLGYFHPDQPESRAAAAFIVDLHTARTEQIVEKWFKKGAAVYPGLKPIDLKDVMVIPESVLSANIPHAFGARLNWGYEWKRRKGKE